MNIEQFAVHHDRVNGYGIKFTQAWHRRCKAHYNDLTRGLKFNTGRRVSISRVIAEKYMEYRESQLKHKNNH